MLAFALAPSTASVLEAGTLSIGGTFHMDQLTNTVGADLAEVFAHNNEHSWSLTLYGITQSYEEIDDYENGNDIETYITRVHATSFDFGFVGPDADVLNEVISQQLTRSNLGGDLFLELRNVYSYGGLYPGAATWDLGLLPLDDAAGVSFFAGALYGYLTGIWFPADNGYGYPSVEPQTIRSQITSIHDSRSGNSGALVSTIDFVDIDLPILILPGDYNQNGIVDAADYTVWRDNLGGTALVNRGPGLSGPIGSADYDVWKANFGDTLSNAGAGAAAHLAPGDSPGANYAVPEPSNLALAALGLFGLVFRRANLAATSRVLPWSENCP
jgi:hypothetical protein